MRTHLHTDPGLWTVLMVECRKLRHSLALTLAVIAPLLIAVFVFCSLLRAQHPRSWDTWIGSAAGVWAFFMLPMCVTALTALVAHVEHAPRSWDYLHALPLPRWHLYAAKTLWVLGVVGLMGVAVFGSSCAALHVAAWIRPSMAPTGRLHAWHLLGVFARMYLSAFWLIAIQLWIALRFRSFVPALATGIAGTFFAVVATSAQIGVVIPWQIPVNMLAANPARAELALMIGVAGGLLGFAVMLVDLGRREIPG